MEDAHIARVNFNGEGEEAMGLFGVFDGHGGKEGGKTIEGNVASSFSEPTSMRKMASFFKFLVPFSVSTCSLMFLRLLVLTLALADGRQSLPFPTGKEVALFTSRMFADVLCNLESFKNGDYENALPEAFHKIDELLEDPVRFRASLQ